MERDCAHSPLVMYRQSDIYLLHFYAAASVDSSSTADRLAIPASQSSGRSSGSDPHSLSTGRLLGNDLHETAKRRKHFLSFCAFNRLSRLFINIQKVATWQGFGPFLPGGRQVAVKNIDPVRAGIPQETLHVSFNRFERLVSARACY